MVSPINGLASKGNCHRKAALAAAQAAQAVGKVLACRSAVVSGYPINRASGITSEFPVILPQSVKKRR
jgi:hypothetical protein